MQMQSWRDRNASEDRSRRQWNNAIHEIQDWRRSDGSRINLPTGYDRAFTNGNGDVAVTNDAFFSGGQLDGNWHEMGKWD